VSVSQTRPPPLEERADKRDKVHLALVRLNALLQLGHPSFESKHPVTGNLQRRRWPRGRRRLGRRELLHHEPGVPEALDAKLVGDAVRYAAGDDSVFEYLGKQVLPIATEMNSNAACRYSAAPFHGFRMAVAVATIPVASAAVARAA
jgi:hypothetical protein